MRYLIDGYNLAFRLYSSKHSLQQKRFLSITELSEKVAALNIEAAIIFDAQHTLDESSRGHYAGLEVHFTNHNETADEYIINAIDEFKTPSKITVVTSDRELTHRARLKGAHSINIETFALWLDKRFKNSFQKIKKVAKPQPPPLQKPPPVKKKVQKTTPVEECLEYYIEAFSVNMPTQEPLPKTLSKLKKKVHPEAIPTGQKVEEDLWKYYLKAFEEMRDS
ncbi:MAG: NYN domain-containing protein [Parachlamydiales bacterium]|jgi:predicted RNA-binding protein with PIN domain